MKLSALNDRLADVPAAATIFVNSTIGQLFIVDIDVEDLAACSLPEPVSNVQQTLHQAVRSYDEIVQDVALPRTKTKRSSCAAGYNYGDENNEQTVKDGKCAAFSQPAEMEIKRIIECVLENSAFLDQGYAMNALLLKLPQRLDVEYLRFMMGDRFRFARFDVLRPSIERRISDDIQRWTN